jgi:hypothetical protein
LIYASLVKIKAAKSHIRIIDRANINTRGGQCMFPSKRRGGVGGEEGRKEEE